ncbi:hypothetical protein CK203_017456 [Vitis vinifera]|uniref:Uncharacterized protein n=1 Tax=Vitis vinifera TaxID=29760 RepID=A0A438IXL2_VITVI|nr:hypothetical protein CK203_017456 [Vitis vinifera]
MRRIAWVGKKLSVTNKSYCSSLPWGRSNALFGKRKSIGLAWFFCGKKLKKDWRTAPLRIFWMLWMERNRRWLFPNHDRIYRLVELKVCHFSGTFDLFSLLPIKGKEKKRNENVHGLEFSNEARINEAQLSFFICFAEHEGVIGNMSRIFVF